MREIIVVGGGVSGWITALYTKTIYPTYKVKVIESSKIGILGAGEGSTPYLIDFLNFVGIDLPEIIFKTEATVKNGIRFTGWGENKNSVFYHPFLSKKDISSDIFKNNYWSDKNYDRLFLYSNFFLDDYDDPVKTISEKNNVPFIKIADGNKISFEELSQYSIHMDASKIALLLKEKSLSLGISVVDGEITNIFLDGEGNVNSVAIDNSYSIPCDFIFDCSGFSRLIIGKKFNSEWISFSDYLPCNKAMAFFLDRKKEIPAYTESVCMDNGWMWKIPLQHRYGCGYVFNDAYMSEDEAKLEIEKNIGHEIEARNIFNFNPGMYKTPWVNNVLSIGLSSGFFEPLEATSIHMQLYTLKLFFSKTGNINCKDKKEISMFNDYAFKVNNDVMEFIYFHYYSTNKTSTEFWRSFKSSTKVPDFVKNIEDISRYRLIEDEDFYNKDIFTYKNYNYVMNGKKTINKNIIEKFMKYEAPSSISKYFDFIYNKKYSIENSYSHNDFIRDCIVSFRK